MATAIKSIKKRTPEEVDAEMPSETNYGHNSGAHEHIAEVDGSAITKAAREKLAQVVAKVERLEEEKKEVADQIRDVYAEAKAMGYDVKALRAVIRLRKQDRQEREEFEAILDTYMLALGEIAQEHYD